MRFIVPGADGPKNLRFRAENDKDRPFLLKLYGSVRAREKLVAAMDEKGWSAFIADQFRLREADYRNRFEGEAFLIVERKKKAIGRMVVHEEPDALLLADIALTAKERGRGVGASLMGLLLEEAKSLGKPLRLHVDEANRDAYRFYLRHGLAPVGKEGYSIRMERRVSS